MERPRFWTKGEGRVCLLLNTQNMHTVFFFENVMKMAFFKFSLNVSCLKNMTNLIRNKKHHKFFPSKLKLNPCTIYHMVEGY